MPSPTVGKVEDHHHLGEGEGDRSSISSASTPEAEGHHEHDQPQHEEQQQQQKRKGGRKPVRIIQHEARQQWQANVYICRVSNANSMCEDLCNFRRTQTAE